MACNVQYSTASAPDSWLPLASANRFDNTDFPLVEEEIYDDNGDPTGTYVLVPDGSRSATLVELTSNALFLAENVGAVRFSFNGYENGGTAYREFVVEGAAVSAVPEPATALGTLGLLASGLLLRRRTRA